MTSRARSLRVFSLSARSTRGVVALGGMRFACALGRAGLAARKREGDGATPAGRWDLRMVLYRADRVRRPQTRLPAKPIGTMDGWCDERVDRNYNRPVRHPCRASAERLWRDDALYDLLVVLGYNMRPRIKGRGSAIFMHLARPGYAPTEGCIALASPHLLRLLTRAAHGTQVHLRAGARKKRPEQAPGA